MITHDGTYVVDATSVDAYHPDNAKKEKPPKPGQYKQVNTTLQVPAHLKCPLFFWVGLKIEKER